MTILWINLFLVFFFSFFARYAATTGVITISGPIKIKPNKIMELGALLFSCI